MSDWDSKRSETSQGGRARVRLDTKCKRKPGDTGRCHGLECSPNYRLIESDKQGPCVATSRAMTTRFTWRRVSVIGGGVYLFELVGQEEVML